MKLDRQWRDRAKQALAKDLKAFQQHDAAVPGNGYYHARIAGTEEALAIIERGGDQPELLARAAALGPLEGGSDRNEGYQTAMRNAWMTVEASKDLPVSACGQRQPQSIWEQASRAAPTSGQGTGFSSWGKLFGGDGPGEPVSDWQQKVYGAGGTLGFSTPNEEVLAEPGPFEPKTLKSRDRALVGGTVDYHGTRSRNSRRSKRTSRLAQLGQRRAAAAPPPTIRRDRRHRGSRAADPHP